MILSINHDHLEKFIFFIVLLIFLAGCSSKEGAEYTEIEPIIDELIVNDEIGHSNLTLEDNCTIIAEYLIPEVWELDGRDAKGTFTYSCEPESCLLIAKNSWENGEKINPYNKHVRFVRTGQLYKAVEERSLYTSYTFSGIVETQDWRKYVQFSTQPSFKIIKQPYEKRVSGKDNQFGFYNTTGYVAEFEVVNYGIYDCKTLG